MLKTLIRIKKFGKKLPAGITADHLKYSGKTIPVYPIYIGLLYVHIDKKLKPLIFHPNHTTIRKGIK